MTDQQQPATTTTAVAIQFSVTPEIVQQLLEFLERGQKVAVSELQKIQPLVFDAEKLPELQKKKEEYVQMLSKSKMVYEKMVGKRKAFTDPIKERIQQIMTFENAIDPIKENNEYAKARKVIEQFDQQLLSYTKQQQQKAELEKRRTQYKIDLRTAVEKRLLEMMTGQQKNLTQGMINWESGLTLENIAAKEASLRAVPLDLNKDKYNACFNIDFNADTNLFTIEDIKAFIEGLKKDFTFEKYNEDYVQMAAPIKNAYLAKLPDVKATLTKIKGDADAAAKRKKDLEEESKTQLAAIDVQAEAKRDAIDVSKDMSVMESEFVAQGTTADLPNQASKKVASFENDNLWLNPLLQVIAHVATNGKLKMKNAKGEFVPEIQKWLTAFESCHQGKVIPGLKLEDAAKTTIRAKA